MCDWYSLVRTFDGKIFGGQVAPFCLDLICDLASTEHLRSQSLCCPEILVVANAWSVRLLEY